jgi:predicted transcriptional regulator
VDADEERIVSPRRQSGGLEREVLEQLWARPDGATPREVLDGLTESGGDLAYTTVMTILTRLWRKGLAERNPSGNTFRYRAVHAEAELAATKMAYLLDHTGDRKQALARFVSGLSRRDEQVLRRLLDGIDEK